MSQKELLDRLEKLEAKFSHLAEKSPKNQPSPPDFGKDIQSIQSRLQKLEKTAVRIDSKFVDLQILAVQKWGFQVP